MTPEAWEKASANELRTIRGVCLDIDDTLSTHGKLTAEAFNALWSLKQAGLVVIPITGRPAGWCDHIARFWPVDAVVGENGAFVFYMEGGVRRRLNTPLHITEDQRQAQLRQLGDKILHRFPGARWASDQAYREYDLAIDICEDVPHWNPQEVDALLELCHEAGASAKLSSIHVNAWFGDYDKKTGIQHWLNQGAPGLQSGPISWNQLLFIGDSPNDEPLFASFQYSVGVANLSKYLGRLKDPPRWITRSESGQGFAEMAARLISRS